MPKRKEFRRIAITLPAPDLAAADRLARDLDRPRSWVIAEAVRRFATSPSTAPREDQPPAEGIGPARRSQLLADLALTPEARVRAAEETARVSFVLRPSVGTRVIGFDRYEDYLAWKRREAAGG